MDSASPNPSRSALRAEPQAGISAIRVDSLDGLEVQKWKNGGGVTLVIAADSSSPPAWRISIATIDRSGAFSDFSGYDRTFVALDTPLTLFIDDDAVDARPLVPVRFRGEAPVRCEVEQPPAHDLNVMTLRETATHRVEVREGVVHIEIDFGSERLVYDVDVARLAWNDEGAP